MALPPQELTMEMAAGRAGMFKMVSLVGLHLGSSMGKLGLAVLMASRMWLGLLWPRNPGLLEWHGGRHKSLSSQQSFLLILSVDHSRGGGRPHLSGAES